MKSIYLVALLTLSGFLIQAQTLNPGFENWEILQNQIQVFGTATVQGVTADYEIDDPQFSYNEISNWSSLNQLTGTASITDVNSGSALVELVAESSDFVEGSKSVRLESDSIDITADITVFGNQVPFTLSNVAPGLIVSGELQLDVDEFADQLINGASLTSLDPFTYERSGQPIDFQPAKLMGSYKYAGVSGDSALLVSGLIKNRVVVAYVIKRLPNAATWTNFELEYTYLSCAMPDTIVSLFCSSNLDASFDNGNFSVNSDDTGVDGSVLFIDNLHMDTIDANSFPPLAVDDVSVIFDNEIAILDVTLNDDVCGGAVPSPVIVANGSSGAAILNGGGEFEYTPNAGFIGQDTVIYSICNDSSFCDTANWFITVNSIPLCIAADDFRSLPSNGSSVFDATANDDDCGTVPNITVLPVNGVANVESNGNISYSPLAGFVGTDSLTYEICSPLVSTQCSSAKVYYEVITSIKEIPADKLSLVPNPANRVVSVNAETNGPMTLIVFNLLGKAIFTTSFEKEIELNLEDYQAGMYLVQFEQEGAVATKKLLIKK